MSVVHVRLFAVHSRSTLICFDLLASGTYHSARCRVAQDTVGSVIQQQPQPEKVALAGLSKGSGVV